MKRIVTIEIEFDESAIEIWDDAKTIEDAKMIGCSHSGDSYSSFAECLDHQMNRDLQILKVKILNIQKPLTLTEENKKSLYCS